MENLFSILLLLTLILLSFVSFLFTIEFEKKIEAQRRKAVGVFVAILLISIAYPLMFFSGYYKILALLSFFALVAMVVYEKKLRNLFL